MEGTKATLHGTDLLEAGFSESIPQAAQPSIGNPTQSKTISSMALLIISSKNQGI
jgi:hypothetical protein